MSRFHGSTRGLPVTRPSRLLEQHFRPAPPSPLRSFFAKLSSVPAFSLHQEKTWTDLLNEKALLLDPSSTAQAEDRAEFLYTLSQLHPSVKDERVQRLVAQAVVEHDQLPSFLLVRVAKALHILGLSSELREVLQSLVKSVEFLSPEVLCDLVKVYSSARFSRSFAHSPFNKHFKQRPSAVPRLSSLPAAEPPPVAALLQQDSALFTALQRYAESDSDLFAPNELVACVRALMTHAHTTQRSCLTKPPQSRRIVRSPPIALSLTPSLRKLFAETESFVLSDVGVFSPTALCDLLECWKLRQRVTGKEVKREEKETKALCTVLARLSDNEGRLLKGLSVCELLKATKAAAELDRGEGGDGGSSFSSALPDSSSVSSAAVAAELLSSTPSFSSSAPSSFRPPCPSTNASSFSSSSSCRSSSSVSITFLSCCLDTIPSSLAQPTVGPETAAAALSLLAHLSVSSAGQQALALYDPSGVWSGALTGHHPVLHQASSALLLHYMALSPTDVASALWSFATSGVTPEPSFLSQVTKFVPGNIEDFNETDLAMTVWAYSTFPRDQNPFTSAEDPQGAAFCTSVLRAVETKFRSMDTTTLSMVSLSLARLRYRRLPMLAELYRAVYAKLPEMSAHQLAMIFFNFSTAGLRDEGLLRRFAFELSSDKRKKEMNFQDLSNVLLAVVQLRGYLSDDFVEGLRQDLLERLDVGEHKRDGGDAETCSGETAGTVTEGEGRNKKKGLLPASLCANFLLALTALDPRPGEVSRVTHHMLPRVSELRPKEVIRCVIAAAHQRERVESLLLSQSREGSAYSDDEEEGRDRYELGVFGGESEDLCDTYNSTRGGMRSLGDGVGLPAQSDEGRERWPQQGIEADTANEDGLGGEVDGSKPEIQFEIGRPFLVALFKALRPHLSSLSGGELLSLVWSLDTLKFSTASFRWGLGGALRKSTKNFEVPMGELCQCALAMDRLGIFHRLDKRLQHKIYSKVDQHTRSRLSPPLPLVSKEDEMREGIVSAADLAGFHLRRALLSPLPDAATKVDVEAEEEEAASGRKFAEIFQETARMM
uniref:FAST kinase leucine-rich domain-containing protein n=1 Tax=Chromera velia CCMP2878 TaxID=1169474 RepID=A0A0G4I9P2_9ALVE|eukprot:Cvel_12213.t1-p1 / transcript=Cvel_12213.t1 / gene=Cvel_12213 / organism=Chromera_velia_CCMP2878 / gene_product=hypothetical protein / transcript_product=hypothetical protein / location=Cvel_scaffold790:8514-16543(+) / protein_length=1054 / sequence_SO=supercontig / SO=protein_coding / is_pseudo=false